jgi:hypothetical protein
MKTEHSSQSRQQPMVGPYVLGMATGVLLAVLTSFTPVVAILGIAALVAATWFALARGWPHERLAALGGTSLGAGIVLLYGAVSTVLSCSQTANFCGNANVLPLVALALGAVASGLFASIALVRTRQ